MKTLMKVIVLILISFSPVFAASGGDIFRSSLSFDKLEYQSSDEKSLSWDGYFFAGYDLNKVYIYSEGEKPKNEKVTTETQLVYSRAVTPFWDFQVGVEYDKTPDESQTWGLLGFQGLAPYFFETKTSLLFSDDGNIGLKVNAEYEALITQKLILSPSIGFSFFSKNNEKMEIGSGLSNINIGTRLRYEVKREFAPYIGIEWNKNYGKTNDYSHLDDTYFVIGFKLWF